MPVIDDLVYGPLIEQTRDLSRAIAAIDRKSSPGIESKGPSSRGATTRRALAIVALGGLLIAGVIIATSSTTKGQEATPTAAGHINYVFDNARSGDCLSWPTNKPDQAYFVDCKDEHLFEVAESVGMRNFQQPCQLEVERYLGARYDPSGRFTIAVLWPGDTAGSQPVSGSLLCGLQLPGADKQPVAFAGKVADLDQSKIWPAGTCLAIDSGTNQPTNIPVDCSAGHAAEVVGAVDLSEKFHGGPPATPDQDAFIREACTRATEGYLAPIDLRSTGLTLMYSTVSESSWMAGSHQVSCGIGATLPDGGLATLVGSAKGRLLINGQAPAVAPTTTSEAPHSAPAEPTNAQLAAAETATPAPSQQVNDARGTTPSPSPTPAPAPAVPVANPEPAPPAAEPEQPAAHVIEIPGLPPITLPMLPPPAGG